eukprot:scaffold2061_cov36-Phaeocystis_antarctica.AAC.1
MGPSASVARGGGGAARRGAADLRCEVGGVVLLQELDDLRVPLALGVVQRRLATLQRRGRWAEVEATAPGEEGGGWVVRRGGAAPAQGP